MLLGDQTGSAEQSDETCRTTDGRCNRRSLPATKGETATFAALVDCAGDQAGTVCWEELVLMRADGAERRWLYTVLRITVLAVISEV